MLILFSVILHNRNIKCRQVVTDRPIECHFLCRHFIGLKRVDWKLFVIYLGHFGICHLLSLQATVIHYQALQPLTVVILVFGFRIFLLYLPNVPYFLSTSRNEDTHQHQQQQSIFYINCQITDKKVTEQWTNQRKANDVSIVNLSF
ncbi:hypothetical protein T11_16695 [Trichinella zimbabwensis]|uniref:Uncharacterized protein n=1 Tax=Trichinella zimbabwensis TaxID=268475 RepID=A0A0V1GY66_9BILA|nr:hypothetical protein T11_16695 [Trichinella zimbabwensis]